MRRALVAAGLALIVTPGLSPLLGPAPPAAASERAAKVLVVSYPRLQWADVEAVAPPALEGLFARGAVASLSIRTADPVTTLPDGYVSIGAGNRAAIPAVAAGHATDDPAGGVQVPAEEVAAARRDADRRLFDAEPGALGEALRAAGLTAGVVGGPDAALAMMDHGGRVATGTVAVAASADADVVAAFDQAWSHSDAVLVEMSALEGAATTGARRDALARSDAVLASLLAQVDPATDLVLVVAPAAPGDAAALTVFGAAGPGIGTGQARSATTRRDGYVTLPDVGVTVLHALGVAIPDAMNGTEITTGGGAPYTHAMADDLAAANTIAVFRDRTVGPVSVIFVALQVVTYAIAVGVLLRRRSRLAPLVVAPALVILAMPAVTFLFGLVRYDRLGLGVYTAAVVVASAVLAALAWPVRRWHPVGPVLALAGVNWLVQVGDIVTGGRLQIDTTFGYSPIVAGRFQGFGNLAFAVVVGAAVVLSAGLWALGPRRGAPRDPWWLLAVAIMAVTVVADGWPAFGADVGGVLAAIPAFAVMAIMLGGWRVNVRRAVAIGAGAVGVVALFALVDLARPPSQRTHLGRFVAGIGDGEAATTLHRKLVANWHVLTSSVFTLLVPVLVIAFAVIITRRRGLLADVQAVEPGLRAGLVGALIAGVLGFALNDSGIAIPAMMIGMVVPWMLVVAMRAVVEPTAPTPPDDARPAVDATGVAER